jgi:glycerol-3-phosphate acyltransferase PlsY
MLVVFVGSYLVGSIPVGYFIVRKKADVDILESGSRRTGGYNAFVVTNSKVTGILVGVLDAFKGFVPVLVVGWIFPQSFQHAGIALFGAITGHNFPAWTKFKGGRGLATAAGGMFTLGFSFTIIWCTIWVVAKVVLKRDILVSNLTAIIMTPLLIWPLPWEWVSRFVGAQIDHWTFIFFSCILSMILLLSHLDVVHDVWKGSPGEQSDKTLHNHKSF